MGLTRIRAEQISDIDYKQAVRVITLGNITLSGGAPSTVDGVNLNFDDRILVAGQSTASQNGLYYVATLGSGSNGTWVRTLDANATGEIEAGMIVMVTEGNTYADTSWKLITNNPITIGSTNLTFAQNTGNSFGVLNANGTPVVANGVTGTAVFDSGNNLVIVGNATSDTITFSVSDSPSFVGNVTGNYILGNGSQLTGLPAGYANANVVSYGETGWAGNIIPSANVTYSLGNVTNQWASVYVGANTLYINNVAVSVNSANTLTVAGANVTTQNANGNISAGNISVSGNVQASYYLGDGSLLTGIAPTVQVYEFANVSSGVSTYQSAEWLASYVPAALANASATVTTTPVNIISFITDANYPGITVIPTGTILVRIQTTKNSGPQGYYCYAQIYSRTSGGTETLIATTDNSSIITQNAVVQQNLIAYITTPVTLNITDRIVVKIFAVMSSGSATITLSYDDNTGSGLQLPALPASAATYVPYNNATANLNLGSYSLSTLGNVTAGNIVNANANGVGNIGSSTNYFNTIFATATSALYADLAEMYVADKEYEPGTVVEFGGTFEIRESQVSHSTRVAGIISTNPSYLMNAAQEGQYVLPVALTGRVPCKVIGKINKGDRLVASHIQGVATVLDLNMYEPSCIIGKALEDYDSNEVGNIEVAVGRM